MPSYTQYMRQMAAMDADDSDIESWITVKGNHIPIKKGQSKEDAVKEFIGKKTDKEFSKREERTQSIGEATKKVVSAVKENREINKAAQKENNRYERPVHISEALKDVMTETKQKMEKKAYNTEGLYQDALNELEDQIADKEKELENIHLSMTENAEAGYFDIANSNMMDIEFVEGQLKELKKKREKLAGSENNARGHGKPEYYAYKWESALEPHNLTNKELEDKLSLYRSIRVSRPDDNELIDKINDIKHVLELRKK